MIIPSGETLVETRSCRACAAKFPITDADVEMLGRLAPVFAGRKEPIPHPTLCPGCRRVRRLSFRNVNKLYRGTCAKTGKSMVSIYAPGTPYTVYDYDSWWGDDWNALDYGQDVDFSRPFLEQIDEVRRRTPRMGLLNWFNDNTDYANHAWHQKNCYLVNNASNNEECYYGDQVYYCNHSVDCLNARHCEVCYEVTDSKECRFVQHSSHCLDCRESLYLYACRSCHHCAGCVNLVNAEYHILNKPVSREEYETFVRDLRTDTAKRREFVTAFERLKRESVRKYANIVESERSIGNNLKNAKNCVDIFDASEVENVRHSTESSGSKDCMDMDVWGDTAELVYETHCTGGGVTGIFFSNIVWGPLSNIYYSDNCVSGCSDLFGCVSLQNKKYCILNKQYTEAEYNELVPRIIEHMRETREWGEFFPSSMSPFGYNETIAMEYFPLSKEEALKRGFRWSDYEAPFPRVEKTIPAAKLPENIADIPDDILQWAIECEVTKKPFRIVKQELEFYRKHNLPIPRRHPDRRHLDRLALRDPRELYERRCDKCSKDIVSVYAPERPERVYCGECYDQEVFG